MVGRHDSLVRRGFGWCHYFLMEQQGGSGLLVRTLSQLAPWQQMDSAAAGSHEGYLALVTDQSIKQKGLDYVVGCVLMHHLVRSPLQGCM